MIGLCSLHSGSKGNATYLGTSKIKLLIDCGLSYKKTEMLLQQLGCSLEAIDYILLTHEHSDHVAGLKGILKHHPIPIITNHATARALRTDHLDPDFRLFITGEPFYLEDLLVDPFSIPHDTEDPVAFTFQFDGIKIGICTDLGFPTTLVKHKLQQCTYLMIEANHEPEMVHASSRALSYKQRVLSRQGHLSNIQCAALIEQSLHSQLKHIILAHLSEECNSPEKARSYLQNIVPSEVRLSIAQQHLLGEVILF